MNHLIHLPDYTVFLGPLTESLPAWLRERAYSRVFVVADANACIHREALSLLPGADTYLVECPPISEHAGGAERLKTLATCEQIWSAMQQARLDRRSLVVNLGGGVVGDMGGFCAATYMRGVDFISVPTTLLAMTDAAIGGKLGIDFHGVKNAVGVFQNPRAVFADPVFLGTLPARELRSGFAEIIKHALIGDRDLWEKIRNLPPNALLPGAISADAWTDLLEQSITVKAQVVTLDPHERGIRALLNFGHTVGHAIESCLLDTDDPLTHGEAVAIGMICEGLLGRDSAADTILRYFGHRALPESLFPDLWERMQHDKKNASGLVRMAVPDAEPFSMRLVELSQNDAYRRLRHYNSFEF